MQCASPANRQVCQMMRKEEADGAGFTSPPPLGALPRVVGKSLSQSVSRFATPGIGRYTYIVREGGNGKSAAVLLLHKEGLSLSPFTSGPACCLIVTIILPRDLSHSNKSRGWSQSQWVVRTGIIITTLCLCHSVRC